ncbi:MAG TPA: sulfotransferase [Segeticoccus sp.]|uniref:sulfotransferase n=1 Tax=Segeticoccus sp. TaxID=2706531 RepID=UPI002D8018C5|nr:sulfotransferase [Segeticoccus sp.]HET8600724.1 sulfotransferase [Segeticoccus sp.]
MDAEHRLVFVGGLHRSGTTPLAAALAKHPLISGLRDTGVPHDEGQHLQPVYPKAKVYAGSGHFAFAPAAHLTESSPLVSAENAQRLVSAWAPYWDLSKPILVEKSPPNLIMGRFLQELFPDAVLVVVVRHPVVVALCNKKWRRLASRNIRRYSTLTQLVEHWVHAHRILLEDASHLRNLVVVRYEDLVDCPGRELGRIQERLGLDEPIPGEGLRGDHSGPYERMWQEMARGWGPAAAQRRRIVRRFADDVAAFGYDVEDLGYRSALPAELRVPVG